MPLFWDAGAARLHLLIRRVGAEMLYVNRLSHAVGDYRLERGGHVGFISGHAPWRPFYYAEWRATEFLAEQQTRTKP